jgi:hypothetical protein
MSGFSEIHVLSNVSLTNIDIVRFATQNKNWCFYFLLIYKQLSASVWSLCNTFCVKLNLKL